MSAKIPESPLCQDPSCKHTKNKHLKGEHHCTEIIELVEQFDSSGIAFKDPIYARRLCKCKKFVS